MYRFILYLILLTFFNISSYAEIIENKKILNNKFGNWVVSCEDDEMLNYIRCRLFVEVTDGTTFFINPLSNKNTILMVSKDGYFDKNFFVKVDNGKIISSNSFTNNRYNIVNFNKNDEKIILAQIQNGNYLYLRFTIKDNSSINGFKEITAKISLAEFQKSLIYFNKQINKYNINNKQ